MIYTIGYQRLDHESIKDVIRRYSIGSLYDVRSKPYSSRPGFGHNELRTALGAVYEWRGRELGGFGSIRHEDLLSLAGQEGNVLLMCMEEHPCDCHRYRIIALGLHEMGHDISHIVGDRTILTSRLRTLCDERDREEDAQGELFS